MARLLAVLLSFYLVLRFADLASRGSLHYCSKGRWRAGCSCLKSG